MTNADGRAGEAAELRIGLIGAGKMGLQHVKAITAQTGTRVIGVADPAADPARLAESLPAGCQVVKTAAELIALAARRRAHRHAAGDARGAGAAGAPRAAATSTSRSRSRRRAPRRRPSSPLAAERGRLVCAGPSVPVRAAVAGRRSRRWPRSARIVHVESYFSFRMARRTITPVDQAKDILPHAVYPLVAQLRAGTRRAERRDRDHRPRRARRAATSTRWLRLGDGDRRAPRHAERPARRAVPAHHRHQRLVPRRLHHRRA